MSPPVSHEQESLVIISKRSSTNLLNENKKRKSFSSNDLEEEENFEYPTAEMSPMKQVHDSNLKKPKLTRMMLQAENDD